MISERLRELEIELPDVAQPVGAYVPARVVGNMVYVSGQIPRRDGVVVSGLVGRDIDVPTGQSLTRECALSAMSAAASAVGGVDRLLGVVKVTGFVRATESFSDHAAVNDGASELFVAVFGEAGRHARASLGVSSLPSMAAVEIDVIFAWDTLPRPTEG